MSKSKKIEIALPLTLRLGRFLKKFKISSKIFPKSLEFKTYLLEQSYSGNYQKLSYEFFIKNLTSFLEKPENQKYESKTKTKLTNRGKSFRLRHIATIPAERQFIATRPDGSELSPASKERIRAEYGANMCCTPKKPLTAQGMNPFTVIRSKETKISAFRSEPKKINFIQGELGNTYHMDRWVSDKMIKLFDTAVSAPFIDNFEFIVTKDKVIKTNPRRLKTQKQVMGGISAIDALRHLGLPIDASEDGRSYHWAHREAHRYGGAQAKENLDPMTAAANYQTLIKVEEPIFRLLDSSKAKEVMVSGMVLFHEELFKKENKKVPIQVLYCIGANEMDSNKVYVCIDPLSHQKPTYGESDIALSLLISQIDKLESDLDSVVKRPLFSAS